MKNHEKYNDKTFENDIALIRLDRKVQFSKSVYPICLPPKGTDFTDTRAFVVGKFYSGAKMIYTLYLSALFWQKRIPILSSFKDGEQYILEDLQVLFFKKSMLGYGTISNAQKITGDWIEKSQITCYVRVTVEKMHVRYMLIAASKYPLVRYLSNLLF